MEAAVVSVSQGAIGSLLGKLGDLLVGEYKLLKEAKGEIMFLKAELESMRAFLERMSDGEEEPDKQAKCWAKEVRDLSYDIEDSVDEFMLRVECESNSKPHGFKGFIDRSMNLLTMINTQHKIAKEFQGLKRRVMEASERRVRYKVDDNVSKPSNTGCTAIDLRLLALYAETAGLVGIDEQRDKLIQLMMDEEGVSAQQLKVLSIVGFGGLGKTTLANEIYRKLEGQFQCRTFVSVSQKPNIRKILRNILSQGGYVAPEQTNMEIWDEDQLISTVQRFLADKRYFIVIDDIWDATTWSIVRCALPENRNGSRVITTTRIETVARACCSNRHDYLYKMKSLSNEDSRRLFFKRVFGSEDACPMYLEEVSAQILKRCGGLPLAIISISSLLASQQKKLQGQWENILSSLGSNFEVNSTLDGMRQVLNLSYINLPHYLKTCMLYMGIYPEDYTIKKNDLVRQWVAQGFISKVHGRDAEDVAEGYFNELVNRSIIQPIDTNSSDGVLSCRIHDMMLDLIIHKCREENFITVIDDLQAMVGLHDKVHRLSLNLDGVIDGTTLGTIQLSQVRALARFGTSTYTLPLLEFKHLRVLTLECPIGIHEGVVFDLTEICHLFQLRYLKVVAYGEVVLPGKIRGLQQLETLELETGTSYLEVPSDVVHLRRLLHLIVPFGTRLPDGIGNMTALRTLRHFDLDSNSTDNVRGLGAGSIMERRTERERSLTSILAVKTGNGKTGKGRTDSSIDVSCANPAVQRRPRRPRARPPPFVGTTSALASTPTGTTPIVVPLASPLPTEPSPMVEDEELENSFDKDDEMSDGLFPTPIDGSDEGGDASGSEGREGISFSGPDKGKKRRKGVNVGSKVTILGAEKSNERSGVWKNFEKVKVPSKEEQGVMILKAKCLYCYKFYSYSQGSTTSHLGRHIKACVPYQNKLAKQKDQALLNFAPASVGSAGTFVPFVVSPNEYNAEQTKKLIAKMIIVHEYPFRMVEHTWFNIVMKYLNPAYQFIGRRTIRNECLKVYESEKEILRKSLKSVDHISLTTDLWTSNQTLCYICIVAHYIDTNWIMQCRVLSFVELDPPHTGHVIAQAVYECVAEWKIEDKIISITLDNASNNDVAIRGLMAKFSTRQGRSFLPKYFHVRCCAHIINLVVNDGTAVLNPLITNIRETVKYIKKSPSRMHKFVEICRSLALKIGEGLKLDVTTRWSSTYKMLSASIAYKEALLSYAVSDANYKWEPTSEEWYLFELVEPILQSLAKVTTAFSGSTYPTANIFYPHIVSVKIALRAAMAHSDANLRSMGNAMMQKFNKYWDEKYNVMVIATILDPRYKMRYVEWCFGKIYESPKIEIEIDEIRKELEKLFEKYENEHREKKAVAQRSSASSSLTMDASNSIPASSSEFQSFLSSTSSMSSKSELLIYLEELNEDLENKNFNLLEWWKLNSHRFPVVSKMARFFLTIPATSVSSESTFSTGGRVLDDYRSSLHPSMVEALVCASSMIRGAHHKDLSIVEEDDDVETILFPTSVVESN